MTQGTERKWPWRSATRSTAQNDTTGNNGNGATPKVQRDWGAQLAQALAHTMYYKRDGATSSAATPAPPDKIGREIDTTPVEPPPTFGIHNYGSDSGSSPVPPEVPLLDVPDSTLSPRSDYRSELSDVILLDKPPSKQTVIIFDWDDTLLCTTYLHAISAIHRPVAAPSVKQKLQQIQAASCKLLEHAIQRGQVLIITNAKLNWLEESAGRHMPQLLRMLQRVTVISARDKYEARYPMPHPNNIRQWKIQTNLELLRNWDSNQNTNLITLGDSEYEMDAARVMMKNAQGTVKCVKFKECPSPLELLEQLEQVDQRFNIIVDKERNLELNWMQNFDPPMSPSSSPYQSPTQSPSASPRASPRITHLPGPPRQTPPPKTPAAARQEQKQDLLSAAASRATSVPTRSPAGPRTPPAPTKTPAAPTTPAPKTPAGGVNTTTQKTPAKTIKNATQMRTTTLPTRPGGTANRANGKTFSKGPAHAKPRAAPKTASSKIVLST